MVCFCQFMCIFLSLFAFENGMRDLYYNTGDNMLMKEGLISKKKKKRKKKEKE